MHDHLLELLETGDLTPEEQASLIRLLHEEEGTDEPPPQENDRGD